MLPALDGIGSLSSAATAVDLAPVLLIRCDSAHGLFNASRLGAERFRPRVNLPFPPYVRLQEGSSRCSVRRGRLGFK